MYPCEPLESETPIHHHKHKKGSKWTSEVDRTRNVEVNPESAEKARRRADELSEEILGWYHSHPTFDVNPSNMDI